MRIVAGKYKSRIISAPEGINTRPTSDRTRESMFNVIAHYIYDANVLDIFSGSGALGIEALSRGAKKVTFVDSDLNAIKCIKSNLKTLKINENIIIKNESYEAIKNIGNEKFDIILLDPPYALNVFDEIMGIINDNNLLANNGVIVYESNEENSLKKDYDGYVLKVKKYGIAYVNFLFKIN